jgi:hypothetical protein
VKEFMLKNKSREGYDGHGRMPVWPVQNLYMVSLSNHQFIRIHMKSICYALFTCTLIFSCHAAEPAAEAATESTGWFWGVYEQAKGWTRKELASVSTEATDKAIEKLNNETIPECTKAAETLIEKGRAAIEQGGIKLKESLNASSSHNAKELAVAGFCLLCSYFGLKLIYDGFNACDETCSNKAQLKIRYGTLITAAGIVTAWLYFKQA